MSTGDFVMPFGKHKDQPLSDIPTDYLDHVLGFDDLWPRTEAAIVAHLETRLDWTRQEDE